MKIVARILFVAFMSLGLAAWPLASEARRGHGYHGHGHYFGHGHRFHHGGHHYGHKRHYYYGYPLYGLYRHYRYYSYPYRYGYSYSSPQEKRSYQTADRNYTHEESNGSVRNEGDVRSARGWKLLTADRPAEARDVFGQFAQANPNKGTPKVGYALASAELGQLNKGIWAMRRALRFDPDALHYITVDETLQSKLKRLADRYAYTSPSSNENPDAAFMLAALSYLLGEFDAAKIAIDRSLSYRHDATSSKNLKRLIEEEIQNSKNLPAPYQTPD